MTRLKCRGYSLPLQRRIVDLAADLPFQAARAKLYEHFRLEIPSEMIRQLTYHHARAIEQQNPMPLEPKDPDGVPWVIAQMDGSMVPLVETDGSAKDRRKQKRLCWNEYRLALAYSKGKVDPIYNGTFGGVEDAGDRLYDCAQRAGLGSETRVHGLGDGANWVADQMDRVFGPKGQFLVDFYHLCDYLAKAAKILEEGDPLPGRWLKKAKKVCRARGIVPILKELKPFVEPSEIRDEEAPVRQCYRYLTNRPEHFDYRGAERQKLPIGSGKVESGHRQVIQVRLKRPGAWWKKENASCLIALRMARLNGGWQTYWDQLQAKAA